MTGNRDVDPWESLRRRSVVERVLARLERRRENVYRDIVRGRQSRIPTWVFAAALGAVLTAWVLWIVLS